MLLLEAGDSATVLEWGQAWLSDAPRNGKTRDVVLAMAVAYCDLAAMKLQGSNPATIESFDFLKRALNLLRDHHVGSKLQEDIQRAMKV